MHNRGRDVERVVGRRSADHHDGASGARRHEPRLDEPRAARGVEGIVDTDAVGQPVAFGDHIGLSRIDGVGGTEVRGGGTPITVGVGHDDARRAGDPRPLHDRDTDAAEAHHENGRTFDDLGRVDDRADTGLQRASDDRGQIERDVVVDAHDTALGGDDALGESTDTEPSVDELSVTRQRGRSVGQQTRHEGARARADGVLTAHAPVAPTARGQRDEHDMVARLDRLHAGTDRFDDTRGFVTEHDRQLRRCRRLR